MHSVEYYELIRRKHFVDGMSLRAIAKELGHDLPTIENVVRQLFEHQACSEVHEC